MTLDVVPRYGQTPSQRCLGNRYGTLFKDRTVLPATHAFIHEWNEPYLPFAFPAEAGPHLSTPKGYKAEFA